MGNISREEVIGLIKGLGGNAGGGSSGGTSNYGDLSNKPSINGVELIGNKTLEDLGLKDENIEFFFWDGTAGANESTKSVQLFRQIEQLAKEGKTIFLIASRLLGSLSSKIGTFIINKNSFSRIQDNELTLKGNDIQSMTDYIVDGANSSTLGRFFTCSVTLTYSNGIISSVKAISTTELGELNFLSVTSSNDETYFKPTKKSQPVSKGYLDETIGKSNSNVIAYEWTAREISDANSDDIKMFREIEKLANEGKTILLITYYNDSGFMKEVYFCINKSNFENKKNNSVEIKNNFLTNLSIEDDNELRYNSRTFYLYYSDDGEIIKTSSLWSSISPVTRVVKRRLLWENPNSSVAFDSQTITLKDFPYTELEIFYKAIINDNYLFSVKILKGSNAHLTTTLANGESIQLNQRSMQYVNDTTYQIENCLELVGNSSNGINNVRIIPYKIVSYHY